LTETELSKSARAGRFVFKISATGFEFVFSSLSGDFTLATFAQDVMFSLELERTLLLSERRYDKDGTEKRYLDLYYVYASECWKAVAGRNNV
jgi:hypothetical protein